MFLDPTNTSFPGAEAAGPDEVHFLFVFTWDQYRPCLKCSRQHSSQGLGNTRARLSTEPSKRGASCTIETHIQSSQTVIQTHTKLTTIRIKVEVQLIYLLVLIITAR